MTHPQASQTGFLQALCPQERALTPLDPLGPAHLDLTQTIFPRRASMTCTCEGLKNVTSHPFLHSPGAATTGPISNRVFTGWGQGTLPMCLQAGWDCLSTLCQSQGACCSPPPGCIQVPKRNQYVSLTTSPSPLPKGDSGNIYPRLDAVL